MIHDLHVMIHKSQLYNLFFTPGFVDYELYIQILFN